MTLRVIFFSAALLCLAAGSALAWLSPILGGRVAATQPPPGSVTCALGPNYTGTVPAGATAAGFTQCALNLPFSSGSFPTSQWLDCAGASSPLLYLTSVTSGTLTAQPCGANTIVTDGGGQALLMRVPPTTGNTGDALFSVKPDHSAGQLFPPNNYIEFRYRLGAADFAQCGSCDLLQFFLYKVNGLAANIGWIEIDWMEVYTGGGWSSATGQSCMVAAAITTFSLASSGCVPTVGFNAGGTQGALVADQTAYHTYGLRLVTDGASALDGSTSGNFTKCMYLDGNQSQCGVGTYTNHSPTVQDNWATRLDIQLQNVFCPTLNNCTVAGNVLSGNQDVFFDHITIWECPAWSPTGITQPGTDVCLNSTGDVTGRLAGAP